MSRRSELGAFLLLAASSGTASAQFGYDAPDSLYPLRVASASEEWVLVVEATHPWGEGPGRCRLERAGEPVWTKELAYTLSDAVVSDGGVVAGYSERGRDGRTELVLVVIGDDGDLRFEETRERSYPPLVALDHVSGPLPDVRDVELGAAEACARFLVREDDGLRQSVARPRRSRGLTWNVYRLATGERLWSGHPLETVAPEYDELATRVRGWSSVPGHDLLLVESALYRHWSVDGVYFGLVDPEGHEVWHLALPDDHARVDTVLPALEPHFRRRPQILEVNGDGFVLCSVATAERITFRVERRDGAWRVAETARAPFVLEPGAGR